MGRIPNEHFVFLTSGYEDEKRELTKRAAKLKKIDTTAERSGDVKRFVALIRRYTKISELTYENVHEFIYHILVYELGKNLNTCKMKSLTASWAGQALATQPTESVSYFRQIGADVKGVVV